MTRSRSIADDNSRKAKKLDSPGGVLMDPRKIFWLAFSLMAIFAVQADQLMKNPDFEGGINGGKASGWNCNGGKCTAGYGFGRNYSNGIKYVGDGGPYEWVYQSIPVTAGERYRYEAWVKTENIVGKRGVALYASSYNAQGRWCETSASPSVSGTSDGWRHIYVDVVPRKGIVSVEVCVRVSDGETGTFFADDFSFARLARPPVKFLVSDAYRDTAPGGIVTFKLVSNLTDGEIGAKGWRGEVRLPDPSSASYFIKRPAPAFTNGVSTFAVDMDKMPFGEFPVSFAFVDAQGRTVVSETVFFNRPESMPERRVRIDSKGRTVVDGKLFFPFGMYMDDLAGKRAEKYVKGPFNCLLPYATLTRSQLDFAEKHGKKVVYSLKNLYRGFAFLPFPVSSEEEETAFVAAKVASVKDHPSLLAWYIQDEMGPGMVPRLKIRDRLVRKVDPDHPTVSCFCRPESALEYMDTSDVLGTDPYPFSSKSDDVPIELVGSETRKVSNAYFGMRPLWQVVQAFDPSFIYKDRSKMRHPNGEEMLNMCLQSVAAGANGVFLWSYNHLGRNALGHRSEDFDKYWNEACKAGEAFAKMIPVFLSDDVSDLVEGARDDLPVRAWRHGGRIWFLAVNASFARKRASVKIDGRIVELDIPPLGHVMQPAGDF